LPRRSEHQNLELIDDCDDGRLAGDHIRPEGTALFNLSRLYGSTIGVAVVQVFFYDNTQAVHLALAKNLTPYRAAAHVTGSISRPGLKTLRYRARRYCATCWRR
jgi:MFS transporter, DHA2 family, multidrug resistance protein